MRFDMDTGQRTWQSGAGNWLFLVSAKPSESRCKWLSHKQMDTLHCRQEIAGSAVQFNSSVSAVPATTAKAIPALVGGRHGGYTASGSAASNARPTSLPLPIWAGRSVCRRLITCMKYSDCRNQCDQIK